MVTGAGGYIGSVFVPKLLLNNHYHVKAVDRFYFGVDKLPQHPHLEIIYEDVRQLQPSLFNGVFYVIDSAADSNGNAFEEATWQINHRIRAEAARMAKQKKVK